MNKTINIIETAYQHISGTDGLPLAVLRIEPEASEDIKGIPHFVSKGFLARNFRYITNITLHNPPKPFI